MSDLSSFFSARFSPSFDLLDHSACGSITAYSSSGRRLLAFHTMQSSFTATVLLYVVNSTMAIAEATALASALSVFGMVGQQSLAVVPSGQSIVVLTPCSATTSVALGANCSSLTTSAGGGSSSPSSSSGVSLATAALVGIVVAAAVGSSLLVCLLIALIWRWRRTKDSVAAQQVLSTPSSPATVVFDRYYLHHSPTPPTAHNTPNTPTKPREASYRHSIVEVAGFEAATPSTVLQQPPTPTTPISPITPITPITPVQAALSHHVSVSVGVQADEADVDECAARLEAEATSHYDDELRRAEVHLGGR